MEYQDWKPVKLINKTKKTENKTKKQTQNPPGTSQFRKLDSNDPPSPPKPLGVDIRRAIQQGRMDRKMSQKDLANRLNISVNDLKNYEAGKTVPNKAVLRRINNVLKIKI